MCLLLYTCAHLKPHEPNTRTHAAHAFKLIVNVCAACAYASQKKNVRTSAHFCNWYNRKKENENTHKCEAIEKQQQTPKEWGKCWTS